MQVIIKGKKGRSIVEVDINKLLELLKKAYADEWIAYYAYKWAAKVASGIISPHVAQLADKIADEEEEHADELAERILELGGTLPYGIEKLHDMANCKSVNYPKDMRDLKGILEALVEAEGCAIDVYNKIVKFLGPCYNTDVKTFHLIHHILGEEIKHEEEFTNLL
jgi:bacterioferritin